MLYWLTEELIITISNSMFSSPRIDSVSKATETYGVADLASNQDQLLLVVLKEETP